MRTVLLVDDDPLVLSVLDRILRSAPEAWQVTTARGGAEAIQLVRDSPFDLVITDIQMPDPNGLEIVREARRRESSTKIVAMTGGGQLDEAESNRALLALGAHEVLQKPFTAQALLAVARRWLGAE